MWQHGRQMVKYFKMQVFFCFVLHCILQNYTEVVTYYAFSRDNTLQVSHTDLTYNEVQQNSNNY